MFPLVHYESSHFEFALRDLSMDVTFTPSTYVFVTATTEYDLGCHQDWVMYVNILAESAVIPLSWMPKFNNYYQQQECIWTDLYVVEFQKRGLPHIHSLVWLRADTENPTPSVIDSFISAEIPDFQEDPLAYALVEEFMVHGPCGEHNPNSPCMKDGVCSKRFPKEYNEETMIDGLGFPVYRRRRNDRYVVKNGIRLDNRWIVPYSLSLLKKFQAYINVEWCNKTNLLKYLFKYLAKGHDMARARFQSMYQSTSSENAGRNKISEYANCRYLSACEACWRMFASDIHVRAPSVERLVVHLECMNRVIYGEDDDLQDVVRDPSKYKTMLTE